MDVATALANRDQAMIGVVLESFDASLDKPLRGGTIYYSRNIRPGKGHADFLEPADWEFIADRVGAIVHDTGTGEETIQYFTSLSDLEEAWERVEELHEADVEATE